MDPTRSGFTTLLYSVQYRITKAAHHNFVFSKKPNSRYHYKPVYLASTNFTDVSMKLHLYSHKIISSIFLAVPTMLCSSGNGTGFLRRQTCQVVLYVVFTQGTGTVLHYLHFRISVFLELKIIKMFEKNTFPRVSVRYYVLILI